MDSTNCGLKIFEQEIPESSKKTKFQFYNMNNDKYLRTDGAINYNLTLSSLMPNYVNLPNKENLQNESKHHFYLVIKSKVNITSNRYMSIIYPCYD